MPDTQALLDLVYFIIPLVLAITLHEAAHGFVANKLGDPTAAQRGRVTFNPIRHIDRFGTIILPALLVLVKSPVLFGFAKPVPVDERKLRHPKTDMIWVALAGPGINLLLAYASALLLHLDIFVTPEQAPWLFRTLYISILVNVVLAVFNMLPILPLDGGRVLAGLLPQPLSQRYRRTEKYGIVLVLLLLMVPALLINAGLINWHPAHYLIEVPALFTVEWVLRLAGIG